MKTLQLIPAVRDIRFLSLLIITVLFSSINLQLKAQPDSGKWQAIFDKHDATGTFVLYSSKADSFFIYNPERANTRFLPASTFKIPNSLIGFETGVISDPHEVFIWNGTDYGYQAWNKDLSLRDAFRLSAVWVYQEIARRVGRESMEYWLQEINYGNMLTGPHIDKFWLEGDIAISPVEQIVILRKLQAGQLPFKTENQKLVKEIMLIKQTDTHHLYAKTGWAARIKNSIGWYVGFVETPFDTWFFALNIDMQKPSDQDARIAISMEILEKSGIFTVSDN